MKLPTNAEKLSDDLWVVSEKQDHEYLSFSFYDFVSSSADDSNIKVERLMHGHGYTGLRECRHTYWGEDGYIYYLNSNHIKIILIWLEQYFDLV